MAHREKHCEDCVILFGKGFDEVHVWLDHMAQQYPIKHFLDYHRTYYHNRYGLEYIKLTWVLRLKRLAKYTC